MNSLLELVGKTPLYGVEKGLAAKLEFFNPSGSMKDRIVKEMLLEVNKNTNSWTIVEATSGNTGISLAMLAPQMNFSAEIFVIKNVSKERKKIMKVLGAKVIETETMEEAKEKAKQRGKESGVFYLNQFENSVNVKAQRKLGEEVVRQLNFEPEYFVAGIGTGGTIMGVGKLLRKKFPGIKIIGVLPADKINRIEGIGNYYSDRIVDLGFLDGIVNVVNVKNKDAINSAKYLIKEKGLLVGISSGANYSVAKKLKNVVTVFADSANRYYSTELFEFKKEKRQDISFKKACKKKHTIYTEKKNINKGLSKVNPLEIFHHNRT